MTEKGCPKDEWTQAILEDAYFECSAAPSKKKRTSLGDGKSLYSFNDIPGRSMVYTMCMDDFCEVEGCKFHKCKLPFVWKPDGLDGLGIDAFADSSLTD